MLAASDERASDRPAAAQPGVTSASIEARGVTKVFPAADGPLVAVDDVSFRVAPSEFVSIVGPSGCGKSTLLRMVGGLIQPSAGAIEVHGERVAGPRTDVGIMFQSPVLLLWKNAFQNALLPRRIKGDTSLAAKQRTQELLELVGLGGFERAYPRQLSGGMQQRVALARLLNTGADVLLLDEPFGALDEFTRERLNLELLRVCGEVRATTLFVTHNVQEAVFLADRVVVMTPRPGRVADVVAVDLPRPRPIDVLRSSEFTAATFAVRDLLGTP